MQISNSRFHSLPRKQKLGGLLAVFIALTLAAPISARAEYSLKTVEKAPPESVSESIRETLQSNSIQVWQDGNVLFEFWFRKAIPLKTTPESLAKSMDAIRETTLCGVVVVQDAPRDYKDNPLLQGPATLRFSLQPQDGNHLGSAEFPYFMTLIPVAYDKEPEGITRYKQMVKASGRDTTTDHPMIFSLRPVATAEEGLPKLTEPAPEHKSVRIQVPGKVRDSDQTAPVAFDLVIEGKGHF
jgi:hypothetical protein